MISSPPHSPDANVNSRNSALERERFKYYAAIKAPLTCSGYQYDWQNFTAWCAKQQHTSLPASPDTVSLYLTDLIERGGKVSSARRRYHAIANRHKETGAPWTAVDALRLLQGAQHFFAEKPRRMRPLTITDIRAISEKLAADKTAIAVRNRAVMLLGFTSALRSASLVVLTIPDLEFCNDGMVLTIPRE